MVNWIYVLECDDNYIYVGETQKLYQRLNQHVKNRGCASTVKHKPKKLIGLYKVNDNYSFMMYRNAIKSGEYNKFIIADWNDVDGDHLLIENHITERFIHERKNNNCYGNGLEWYKVRGGKYTYESLDETVYINKWASEKEGRIAHARTHIESIPEENIVDRPLCKCNIPAEVKLSKDKTKIYFVCSLKNVWDNFFTGININEPCDFWKMYTEDNKIKKQYDIIKTRSKENWITNIPEKYSSTNSACISCNKYDYLGVYNKGTRRLCQSCLLTKYDSLKKEYDKVIDLFID